MNAQDKADKLVGLQADERRRVDRSAGFMAPAALKRYDEMASRDRGKMTAKAQEERAFDRRVHKWVRPSEMTTPNERTAAKASPRHRAKPSSADREWNKIVAGDRERRQRAVRTGGQW